VLLVRRGRVVVSDLVEWVSPHANGMAADAVLHERQEVRFLRTRRQYSCRLSRRVDPG
jgi:hypothetical protein